MRYPAAGNYQRDVGTIAMWVKPSWSMPCTGVHGFSSAFDNAGPALVCDGLEGDFEFISGTRGSRLPLANISAWNNGGWNHLLGSWNRVGGSLLSLMVNGLHRATSTLSWKPANPTVISLRIGNSDQPVQSVIDEVIVWDRLLNKQEQLAVAKLAGAFGLACSL